jgi:hypothetical protein
MDSFAVRAERKKAREIAETEPSVARGVVPSIHESVVLSTNLGGARRATTDGA